MVGERRITDLVERFYADAWNGWDDRAVDELLSTDFAFRGSLGDEAAGRDGFRAYRDRVRAAFPDFHNEVTEIVADGPRAAARVRCTGRHDGELFGIAPTGHRVAYDAVAFFRSHEGRLCEAWVLGDLERLRGQLNQAQTTPARAVDRRRGR